MHPETPLQPFEKIDTKPQINVTYVISLLTFAIFCFGAGYIIGGKGGISKALDRAQEIPAFTGSERTDLSLFWHVWSRVSEKYVATEKINEEKMNYGAIKGMVAALDDPYTFFLTPDENKQSKDDMQGKFEGIGAQLGLRDNKIIVVAPIKNSPAEAAGVRSGDIIYKVDGKDVTNQKLPQIVSQIRGKKGTTVAITFIRNDKELEIKITRDQIITHAIETDTFGGGKIAYIKVNQFGDFTNSEWSKAVSEVVQKYQSGQVKSLIVDVRDNPGGYLDSSVYLAEEFPKKGDLIVSQKSRDSAQDREYRASRTGNLQNIPVTVLINKGSASASEILSGALRDNKRAKLIGEKSFGKGSVQEVMDFGGGAGLHVTVAKWLLPGGDWIHGVGITPEIVVEQKKDEKNTITKETDMQLQKAIELLEKE